MAKCYTKNIILNLKIKTLDFLRFKRFNTSIMKFFIIGLLFLLIGENGLNAALRTASVSGIWNSTTTWGNAAVPTSVDDVVINSGITVTVDVSANCNSLTFVAGIGGTVTVSSGITLAVTNAVTLNNAANANVNAFIAGQGTLNCAALNVGDGTAPTGNSSTHTHTLTSTVNSLNINANLSINSYFAFNKIRRNGVFLQTSGTLTINGSIVTTTQEANNNSTFTLGGTNPTLILGGATPFTISGTGTSTITLNGPGATVNYANLTGGQALYSILAYNNLTLSNTSGTQTASGSLTVDGTLTTTAGGTLNMVTNQLLGTFATVTNGGTIQTQNTSATPIPAGKTWGGNVVFNGISGQTLPASTFNNLTINTTGGVTLSGTVSISSVLTLTNGIVTTSNSNLLTLTNTATTAISGGSTTAFVSGPLLRTLPASLVSGSTYNFPVGKGSTYLPFSLVNPTTGTGVVTSKIEAFGSNAGGTSNATLNSISNTEYWLLETAGNFTNSSVSATRQAPISPNDVIAGSTTVAGQYTTLAGTVVANGVTGSNAIGTNRAFVLASKISTITAGTIAGSSFCVGASVSVPFTIYGTYNSGNIFTAQISNASGSFASPVNIGTLTSTTAGTITATIPVGTAIGTNYRIRVVSSNPAITGTDNGVNLTINALPAIATTTGGLICIGSTANLSASGAVAGDKYVWYSAASGGTPLKTSTNNTDNIFTTPTLVATTNYWVAILNTNGCEGVRTQVTATFPTVSNDNETAAGTNTWIGHLYDGIAFNTYYGRYFETETFNQSFGGTTNCFGITSNAVARSIYTETFSVRYRMNSTKKGLYRVDMGSDDGNRLTVDGTLVYSDWSDHPVHDSLNVLLSLNGASSLIYDFYENGGGNTVYFQNLNLLLANNLTTNTTQSISAGSLGTAISGDVYGTLPTGISLSGTGYQWTYSTTPGGARINISGATGATYTPNTSVAPFNVAGTYYIFRNALLSRKNNVSPNPYIATSESNVVTLTVYVPTIVVSPSSLNGFSYIFGFGPSSQQSFTVSGSNLVDNIIVTPTTNYEISTTSGTGFQSTAITLTQSGGTVASTPIYVRLKAGLTAGNYNLENIVSTSASAVTKNVACSGTVYTPTINTSVTTLTGFTYPEGYGPSAEQSFTVSGTNLVDNIKIYPSPKFEISTGSGVAFVPTSVITLTVSGGTVNSTTIYVRTKTGLPFGSIAPENISSESTGATIKNVACSGTVVTSPLITTSAISGTFSYIFGSGPSASKTFTVNGTYLGGSVVITPPTNYEISSDGGTNYYSSPIILVLSSGNAATYTGVLNLTTITIRLKTALGTGSYSENVIVSSTSAVSKIVSLSGTVTASATIFNAISSLSGFIYTLGNGPSGFQSFVVKASALTDNVIVTPPAANFEISKDSVNFQSMQLTLLRNGTTLTADTIVYVRMKSGLAVGDYGPLNSSVVLTSAGAITKSVACKGIVVNTKALLVSKNALTGFGYLYSASPIGGPSSPQSFTVSGALLTGNIIITAPTNYEISNKSSSGYSSTISLTGTNVNPTIIYVRLKSGLPAADYGTLAVPLNLTVASSGATTINVFCIGKVFASPLISASGGGSFCEGSTINLTSTGSDIQSFYWTGPNNYYLSTQNPVLSTNATASLSGTYTVSGSVVVGGNLITNGDFEAGNTSFSSGYGYVAPSATALNPEGMYTIVNLPSAVHGDFTNHPDHTTGTGLQMVVNGSPIAGVVVWSQSVPVIPGASYQFTYSEQTVNITQVPKNASQLQLYVNGVAAGPVYTAPLVNYQWATFMYNATAGTNAVLNLELINQNTIVSGNDFSLDDIVFQQILPATAPQIVIVSPSVVASVNVTYSPTNVYQNVPVVFTANPINGGVTPAYKWFVGGVEAVGQTSSTFSYTPSSTALLTVRCEMTTSIVCASPKPAIDTEAITVQAPLVNYWMGYTDIDWGKPENWTAGYVPVTGDNVIYATVANFGTSAMKDLQLDQNRTIGSLINATTKRLVIPAAKGLTVNNTIDISNKVNEVDRIYIYSSSTLPNGSLSFKNLSSNPVAATVEMYSKAWWNLTDTINNRFRWQYFGIPLRSVVAFPTFNGSYVRRWDETKDSITNHWILLNNSSVLQPFYGYEICQEIPKKVYFKGILENGNFNSGPLAITSLALFPGQHIFANPYTAAIDIRQLTFGEGMQKTVYLYNTGTFAIWKDTAKIKNTLDGQYTAVPYNLAGFSNGLPRQVPSMQAMLVKATTVVDANFSINYNSVIMNNTDQQRINEPNEVSEEVSTKIDLIGENFNDKMWLFSKPECSRNYDNGWDGFKMYGNALNPQIFAIEPDGNYQVSTVEDMNNTNLGFLAGSDVQYTFKFTQTNIRKHYQGLYLIDLIENKTVDITETGSEYKFYAESTPKPVNRFKIATRPYEQKASDFNSQVKIFSAGKTLFIHNFSNVEGEFVVYDISGRILKKGKFGANGITGVITNYISGGYVVRAKTSLEEVSKRIILR